MVVHHCIKMDSDSHQRVSAVSEYLHESDGAHHTAAKAPTEPTNATSRVNALWRRVSNTDSQHLLSTLDQTNPDAIAHAICSGYLLVVDRKRRSGLIILKEFHAEFAGPGAAVGGLFDEDCQAVIIMGDSCLTLPESPDERQEAYKIRRQWIRLAQQFTDHSLPTERARMILNQFEIYFDQDTIARVPDAAFAQLVGVLPNTIRLSRRSLHKPSLKVRTQAD